MSSHSPSHQSTSSGALIKVGRHLHLRGTSIMVFITYWMMIFTYPNFFIVNPLAEDSGIRQLALWICLFGWIIQSLITPVLLWKISDGYLGPLKWIPIATLLWPIGIFMAQVTAFMQSQTNFLIYLIDYPIFVITDIALPALILWKWYELDSFVKENRVNKTF